MYTSTLIQLIALDTIQLSDDTFTLLPYENDQPTDLLIESIRQYGILHPPIVLKKNSNKHIIVTGKKRIKAAQQLAVHGNLPCLCLPADTSAPEIYQIILEESLFGNQLSIVEQAFFFKKASTNCSQQKLFAMMEKLGHKPHKPILDNILNLLSLDKSTLLAVHNGIISQNNAKKLLKLSAQDQKILGELISTFHIGGSKQKKIIEFCTELIMRRKQSLSSILDHFYPAMLEEEDGNKPQQVSTLLNWLRQECFPTSSAAEVNFERLVSQLNLPAQCKLQHSKSFEDDSVYLSINFKTFRSMQTQLPEIIRALTSKTS